MPVSDAQRKANNKWNKENRIIFSCSTNKKEAEAFLAYAQKQGKTANALLKGFILSCIDSVEEECENANAD